MPVIGDTLNEQMAAPKENRNENRENVATSSPGARTRLRFGLFLLILVSAAFRFWDLGLKPPHFDEGINGHFVITIWRDGFYSYDPTNFHGPLFFYICHLGEILFGRGVESFRIMNAALSLGLVFSVYQLRQYLGRTAIAAAWILAVSPAFTFYGRYAIHETLFILGQVFFVYGRFMWFGQPSRRAMTWMAAGLVILIATKETFFIFVGTWIIAEFAIWFLERLEKSRNPWTRWSTLEPREKKKLRLEGVGIGFLSALILAALYSGFFEHTQGFVDFFRAFDFWSHTGQKGNGHEKPFFYWIQTMGRYEWAFLLGLVVAAYGSICLRFENRKLRILLLVGIGQWLAYSLIPYKTPWLILNFWPLAFLLLPSTGRAVSKGMARTKYLFYFVLLALGAVAVSQSLSLNFEHYADSKEPYVYVQTTTDYSRVMDVLRKKLAQSPDVRNGSIIVMIQDPWPLPYDLSLYPKMRYVRIEELDRDKSILQDAALVLIDGNLLTGLKNIFPKKFGRMKFQLRDAYNAGWALFDYDMFQSVLPADVEVEEPGGVK